MPTLRPSAPLAQTPPENGPPATRSEFEPRRNIISGPVRSTLFLLAMPILAEQILNTCVGLFDTFLAGRISAAATSAIGLAAYVDWLASMMLMLVGTGTTALVSRHKGAGDVAEANHFMNQSLILGVGLGFCVMILGLTLAPWFARYCNMTGEAFDITVTFLRIDSIGYVFASLTYVGCASLRGVGDMRTPMLIFATINVVNAVVSSSLVYGWGPFPLLGVNGIVCGTVTARLVGTLLTLSILAAGRSGLKLSLHQLPIAWARTWRILRIGLPAGAEADLTAADVDLAPFLSVCRRAESIDPADVAPPPLLSGDDLTAMGMSPGPRFGEILKELYRAQLNTKITTRHEAITLASELMKS